MVVGKGGTVVEAVTLRARATVVRASRRACKVNGSTPLAALLAALGRERIGVHVRDFGSCERRAGRSSAQLFVDRIARERNRGQNGWVYKVNDFARSVGAADASAPRLRDGARVLWLYCVMDAGTRSCQRSLRVTPQGKAGPGGTQRVLVRAYDDERKPVAAGGATVTAGAVSAVADAKGQATAGDPVGSPPVDGNRGGHDPLVPGAPPSAVTSLRNIALALATCAVLARLQRRGGRPQGGQRHADRDTRLRRDAPGSCARGPHPRRRDRDAVPDAQGEGRRDAVRRTLRERDRRGQVRDGGRYAPRLVLLT